MSAGGRFVAGPGQRMGGIAGHLRHSPGRAAGNLWLADSPENQVLVLVKFECWLNLS